MLEYYDIHINMNMPGTDRSGPGLPRNGPGTDRSGPGLRRNGRRNGAGFVGTVRSRSVPGPGRSVPGILILIS